MIFIHRLLSITKNFARELNVPLRNAYSRADTARQPKLRTVHTVARTESHAVESRLVDLEAVQNRKC